MEGVNMNIIKTDINYCSLNAQIDIVNIQFDADILLTMNSTTADLFTSELYDYKPDDVGKLCTYEGNKVYIDDDLPLGEVKIWVDSDQINRMKN